MQLCSEKLPGASQEVPGEKHGFSLPEMRVPAGEPHRAAPHPQCGQEGEVVVRGEVAPPPTCQGEMGAQPSAFVCAVCLDFRLLRQVLSLTVCTVLGPVSPDLCQGTQAPLQY